jgi:hypothetical protein
VFHRNEIEKKKKAPEKVRKSPLSQEDLQSFTLGLNFRRVRSTARPYISSFFHTLANSAAISRAQQKSLSSFFFSLLPSLPLTPVVLIAKK